MTRLFLECTVRAALIVLGTAIVLYMMRVKVASVKHRVWTAVLLLMLALPFWIVWGPKAPIRILPTRVQNFAADVFVQSPAPAAEKEQKTDSRQTIAAPVRRFFSTTEEVLLGLYLFGALILIARLAIGTVKASHLIHESVLVDGIMTSGGCAAPVTVGCLRPTVILPLHWREWTRRQLDVVLAHEGEHVRRRDPLVQWLALLNRAIFWFHPAAWWLERELSALAEECCDAAVIAQGHDPREYAETLMKIARDVMDSGSRINSVAVAMPGVRLPERIRRIIGGMRESRLSRTRTLCAIGVCVALGAMFVAGAIAAPQGAVDSTKAASGDPVFEAASVKESAPGGRRFGIVAEPGGRLTANNATLNAIIRTAYNVNPQEMVAGPEFDRLLSERFDIEAKAQDDSPQARMKLMLQALLADRFKLTVHHETRQLPVFALVVSKPGKIGTQLVPHPDDANCPGPATPQSGAGVASLACGDMMGGLGHLTAEKISMSDFAAFLSGQAGRLVLDRTGLMETFDLTLKYTPDQQSGVPGPDAATPDPLGPSLFTALQEQLGLRLDSQVAPVDVLVIDHVEEPTAN